MPGPRRRRRPRRRPRGWFGTSVDQLHAGYRPWQFRPHGGEGSTARISTPKGASWRVNFPVPAPRSITRFPGPRPKEPGEQGQGFVRVAGPTPLIRAPVTETPGGRRVLVDPSTVISLRVASRPSARTRPLARCRGCVRPNLRRQAGRIPVAVPSPGGARSLRGRSGYLGLPTEKEPWRTSGRSRTASSEVRIDTGRRGRPSNSQQPSIKRRLLHASTRHGR